MLGRCSVELGFRRRTPFLELHVVPAQVAANNAPLRHALGAPCDQLLDFADREGRLDVAHLIVRCRARARVVHVHVDQARNHRAPAEVDDARVLIQPAGVLDGGNAAIADGHLLERFARAVDEDSVHQADVGAASLAAPVPALVAVVVSIVVSIVARKRLAGVAECQSRSRERAGGSCAGQQAAARHVHYGVIGGPCVRVIVLTLA